MLQPVPCYSQCLSFDFSIVASRLFIKMLLQSKRLPKAPAGASLSFPLYFAASNSASISAEGAGVTRLTTTQTTSEVRKAGSSS